MPCSCEGYVDTVGEERARLRAIYVNDTFDILCSLCGRLIDDKEGQKFLDERTMSWYKQHLKDDAARIAKEKKEAEKAEKLKELEREEAEIHRRRNEIYNTYR